MRRVWQLPLSLVVLSLVFAGVGIADSAEVLVNGNLEASVSPVSWTLTTEISDDPESSIPGAIEHVDGANYPGVAPGQLGLLIKPPAANQGVYQDLNKQFNVVLEQIRSTSIVPTATYTATGHFFFQDGYSGMVETLNEESPSGAIESPTETYFEMAFLDSSNNVLGSPVVFDMRTDLTTLAWREHQLVGVAPAMSSKIRVRAYAENIIDNCCAAGQDLYFDRFNLRSHFAPNTELLANSNLDLPGDPAGFTTVEDPDVPGQGRPDSVAFINFAQRTGSSGQQGMWLRPFVNTTQYDPDIPTVDAVMTQVLDAIEGATYDFTAWSRWEAGYSGAINASGTDTFMKVEFLDGVGAVIGAATEVIDLFTEGLVGSPNDGQTADNMWRQFAVPTATAPMGAVDVRVSLGATGMFNSFSDPQSAFFDDLSLIETLPGGDGLDGDYNGNDIIDSADYTVWRDAIIAGSSVLLNDPTPGTVTESDFTYWRDNFGDVAGAGAGSASAIPEPSSFVLLLLGAVLGAIRCRRRAV